MTSFIKKREVLYMLLSRDSLSSMFRSAALLWQENVTRLGEIDSRFGDGDHGITVGKMAGAILSRLNGFENESIKSFIEGLSSDIMGINGGSAGPLYGTLFEGLSAPLSDETEINAPLLKAMFTGAQDALFEITKARVGDKTMMDALIPAVTAARGAQGDVLAVLNAAAAAAARGCGDTENMVSKFGRARSYGSQTIGVPDAGAVSAALLFEGFNNLKGGEQQ
ncbi:dihydroxyacetone kinase subunit L [Synergistales bacterium]|nr:dihydroxyacetone kinase subunit L [Synergistales bacterium]